MSDAVGFEAFYRTHRRHVVAYCLRRADRPDAFEAADETFLVAWRRFDEIPPEQPRAWLYGVAYRVLTNQRRSQRRRQQLGTKLAGVRPEALDDPDSRLVRYEEQRLLWRAYERLGSDDQEVLRLAAWEELPHEQIGLALGCGTAAARQRLHRARERLGRELERAQRRTFAFARKHDDD